MSIDWTDSAGDPSVCPTRVDTESPDTSGTPVDCDDGDGDGNVTIHVKIDMTPPSFTVSPGPDSNGWYNHTPVALTISNASDALSGVASCSDPPSYSGPDGASVNIGGGCTDNAGNTRPVRINLDTTPPTFTVSPGPDSNGWYNHAATLTITNPSDALSGLAGPCTDPATYSGPDGASRNIGGGCTDNAGNVQPVVINYDATPPQIISAALDRSPDRGDWYNHEVGASVQATDDTSHLAGCSVPAYSGPDSATAVLHGSCSDNAGNTAPVDLPFQYDATSPTVTGASASRPPDHNGWYNHPVSFTFTGTDALSQIASCTSATYSGPVDSSAAVNGACTDNAGNIGLGNQAFKYDDVRPAAAQVQITPGNRRVDVSWVLPKDADSVTVSRSEQGSSAAPVVVYSGARSSFLDKGLKNGVKYRYAVTDMDQAGNQTTSVIRAIPTASSLRPFVGTVVSSPPLLTWKNVKRARYYNVQLFFGKKKVLSIWPRKPSLQLKGSWHFRGKTYTFKPGHYRWYVWPGFGPLAAHNYGNRLGRSSFRAV